MPQVASADISAEPVSKVRRTISKLMPSVEGQLSEVPRCSHGPALKFNRVDKSSGVAREFYACSANRDRKICSLFHWVEDWERKLKRGSAVRKDVESTTRVKKSRPDEELGVSALVDNESNAQFLFDKTTVSNIVALIKHSTSGSGPVLCIGTPTIHAALLREKIDTVLLDEDERLGSIYANTHRFNMFNGTFYDGSSVFKNEDNFSLIITDPPFHPELIPAMLSTMEKLFPVSFAKSPILLAFPYFNQSVLLPRLEITDIRLTYRNHKKYGKVSPVRLFVANMGDYSAVSLTDHKLCDHCNKVVHSSNVHCDECNACTTVTGTNCYIHCNECGKCVKPKSVHCKKCKRCHLGPHRDNLV